MPKPLPIPLETFFLIVTSASTLIFLPLAKIPPLINLFHIELYKRFTPYLIGENFIYLLRQYWIYGNKMSTLWE